MELLKV